MKKHTLFAFLATFACLAPAFADDIATVITGDEPKEEEVVVNKDCGCGQPKDKKPPKS